MNTLRIAALSLATLVTSGLAASAATVYDNVENEFVRVEPIGPSGSSQVWAPVGPAYDPSDNEGQSIVAPSAQSGTVEAPRYGRYYEPSENEFLNISPAEPATGAIR